MIIHCYRILAILGFLFIAPIGGCERKQSSAKAPSVAVPQEQVAAPSWACICIGPYLSKGGVDQSKRIINIGMKKLAWPSRQSSGPTKICLQKSEFPLQVQTFFDGKPYGQNTLSTLVEQGSYYTYYRSAGYFRLIRNERKRCEFPVLGVQVSNSGGVPPREPLCFDYKIKAASKCRQ